LPQYATKFGGNHKTSSAARVAPAVHAEKGPERQQFDIACQIHASRAIPANDLDGHWFSQTANGQVVFA
jgi:hypothetical protein